VAFTNPSGITPAGVVAGSYGILGNGVSHGFLRAKDGTIITIDAPGDSVVATSVSGINPAEMLTGYYSTPSINYHGFVRTRDGGFTTFDPPGAPLVRVRHTFPTAINPAGTVTGNFLVGPEITRGFVRNSDGTITAFDAPGAGTLRNSGTAPSAINPAGAITGYYFDGVTVGPHGFVRTAAGIITTFDAPGSGTQETAPTAISPDGAVTGQCTDESGIHGFIRAANGSITTFDVPDTLVGNQVYPTGITPEGTIIGTYYDLNGAGPDAPAIRGFLRTKQGGLTTFDIPNGAPNFTSPIAINPAGMVTGFYNDPAGEHGFLWSRKGTAATFDGAEGSGLAGKVQSARDRSPIGGTGLDHGDGAAAVSGVLLESATGAGGSPLSFVYSLPMACTVSIGVFDIAGRRVATLGGGQKNAGMHEVKWNATGVARGVYFCRLVAGPVVVTRSVLILQ
jgi:hypothetical protein